MPQYPNYNPNLKDVEKKIVSIAKLAISNEKKLAEYEALEYEAAQANALKLLVKAYRSVDGWEEIIRLIPQMPSELRNDPKMQEQLAIALNKSGRGDEGEKILKELIKMKTPGSETYSILGSIYKRRWLNAKKNGNTVSDIQSFLDQAIEYYIEGFAANPGDYYPGINALTLIDIRGTHRHPDEISMEDVQTALETHVEKDYWYYATLMELSILQNKVKDAREFLNEALSIHADSWQLESTAGNLSLIREGRKLRGENTGWIKDIEDKLYRG